jgi:CubicO group peptidase (beta-lactamase class C family)
VSHRPVLVQDRVDDRLSRDFRGGEFPAVAAGEGDGYSAQLAVYRQGERVVDLWAGPEITGDSLIGVFSASKGATHLVVALLVQDGVLNLDQRVSHWWPEFAVESKREVTLRELMSHRAGLVGADNGFTLGELADDRSVAERLGGQRPYWRPGSAFGYHALVIASLSARRTRNSGSCRTSGRPGRPRSAAWPRRAAWPGCTPPRSAHWTARRRC